MGGYGSGRPSSGKPTTDPLLFLDIRYLRKRGYFATGVKPGYQARCSVEWSSRGEPSGDIRLIVPGSETPYPPEIILTYRTRGRGETAWTDVSDRVMIETTECHYGGERPWFLCPRCGSRRAVLFSVGGRFRCRECHRAAYSSTRETEDDRAARRALAIQKRLGGHKHGTIYDPEPKPPHMHWKTYARLCDELDELNILTMRSFMARFGKLEKRFPALEDASLGDLARLL
jgi:hypothetical protein